MPMVQAFWNKLNANEKLVGYGAGIVVIAFLLGAVGGGLASYASADIVAAIAIGVIYWLKYSPNKITWPAPVQTIVVVIAGISAIFALLAALFALSYIGSLWGIATIVNAIGCGVMFYGAWKEYQAMPKTTSPATPLAPPPAPPPTSPAAPLAPPPAPPATPLAPPPAPPATPLAPPPAPPEAPEA